MTFAGPFPAIEALREVAGRGEIIEDFQPYWRSLGWELGQQYWQAAGSRAFFGEVPFKITSDGNLSRKAAGVLFASVAAAEARGALGPTFEVLEIGAGLGLFARYLLDDFRARCREAGCDYYERLTYVVADRAQRMLDDLQERGTLAGHAEHCRFLRADASRPGLGADGPARFQAVFLNYLLDCLPTTVVRFEGGRAREAFLRTRLARGVDLRRHSPLGIEDIRRIVASPERLDHPGLGALHRLFTCEVVYRPVDPATPIPYLDSARVMAGEEGGVVLHNFGAITCLEQALPLLAPGGFVLLNDYDDPAFDSAAQSYRHQQFGHTASFGLNLPLLEKHFSGRDDCLWLVPPGQNRHLSSRLLGRDPDPATTAAFGDLFSQEAFDRHFGPVEQARAHLKTGRHESALASFTEALALQPHNWALLAEIAAFLAYTLHDHAAALRLTASALQLNPQWPDLWNIEGDCHYYLGRIDEAHAAFSRALELDPAEVRARYNLTYTFLDRADPAAALRCIGEALGLDRAGKYRTRLLEKQTEILKSMDDCRREAERCGPDRFHSGPNRDGPAAGPLAGQG